MIKSHRQSATYFTSQNTLRHKNQSQISKGIQTLDTIGH